MRLDFDTYREIADALVRNKSRSLLTGFGIFWGIFMLIFMLGGSKGVKEQLANNFDGFAANMIGLVSGTTEMPYEGFKKGRYWNLTTKDVDRLKSMLPELDEIVPEISAWGQDCSYEGHSQSSISMKGVTGGYTKIEAPQLKYGRYINDADVINERKVCVIGRTIYESLFPEGGDPCGEMIRIGSIYFKVIGVDMASSNISINGSSRNSAVIPISVIQKLLNRGAVLDIILMTVKPGYNATQVEKKIRTLMAREHHFNPEDKAALFCVNSADMFKLIDNVFTGVDFMVWLIGLGTILAGAIGVSNIMMVTVRERTTEIGIRRAIGATPRDILSQIMMESVSLTVMAGTSGLVLTVLILEIIEKVSGTSFQINFWTALISLLLLSVLGVLSGLAPASRAMGIKPVAAMRDE